MGQSPEPARAGRLESPLPAGAQRLEITRVKQHTTERSAPRIGRRMATELRLHLHFPPIPTHPLDRSLAASVKTPRINRLLHRRKRMRSLRAAGPAGPVPAGPLLQLPLHPGATNPIITPD